jgi:phospholipid/cholesterol/gamma-HCH transport system permease protein
MKLLAAIGRMALSFLAETGRLAVFAIDAVTACIRPPIYWGLIGKQAMRIGYFSLPVVGLTAFFTGGVLALQIFIGSDRYGAEAFVPQIVVLGITRELGPVIAGLMVAGRVAAAIAAEIGTMRVTEQLDALATLRTDSYRYLIAPRLVAAVLALPVMVLIANSIGIMGGYLLSIYKLGFNPASYLATTRQFLEWDDIRMAVVKAAVFGFIIALMGCYNGLHTRGGAAGVGKATTDAVVSSFVLILFSDLVITIVAFG